MNTQPAQAGHHSLTRLQLEVVGRRGLPGQGQGHQGLQMWHVLLHVQRGVADAVGKQLFNHSSWHKNQSPPCDVVTNCEVTRLLQDFNLKHTGKHIFLLFCSQFNRYLMGLLTLNMCPLRGFYPVIPYKPYGIS